MACALERQPNLGGIGPRRNDEVIFEIASLAVEDQVDPVVNPLYPQTSVLGNIRVPVFTVPAKQIVANAARGLEAADVAPGMTPAQVHADHAYPGFRHGRRSRRRSGGKG